MPLHWISVTVKRIHPFTCSMPLMDDSGGSRHYSIEYSSGIYELQVS